MAEGKKLAEAIYHAADYMDSFMQDLITHTRGSIQQPGEPHRMKERQICFKGSIHERHATQISFLAWHPGQIFYLHNHHKRECPTTYTRHTYARMKGCFLSFSAHVFIS